MFVAQPRSGPTAIGRTNWERMRSSFTTRKTGNGQSGQCFRKKKAKGRQASKKASQLETTMATELANAFSSGIRNRCGSRIQHARDFFSTEVPFPCGVAALRVFYRSPKIRG